MPVESLSFFELSEMQTNNWFAVNSTDGGAWNVGTDYIQLNPSPTISTVSVNDDDTGFGDDDFSQTLSGGHWLGGQFYGNGTFIENEYMLTIEDSLGNQYLLAAVTVQNDAWTTKGYAFVGTQPPSGEQMTVVAVEDSANMIYNPVCFTPGTLIRTDRGDVPVEVLAIGDRIWTLDHGHVPLRVIARRRFNLGTGPHPHKPILISHGALGQGLPARDLVVSPQHRVLLTGADGVTEVLVPARALTGLPGIREMHGRRSVDYIHIMLREHEIVAANGALTETLLPGPVALAGLDPLQRARIFAATEPGRTDRPVRPLLTVRAGRALLRGGRVGAPCVVEAAGS